MDGHISYLLVFAFLLKKKDQLQGSLKLHFVSQLLISIISVESDGIVNTPCLAALFTVICTDMQPSMLSRSCILCQVYPALLHCLKLDVGLTGVSVFSAYA